MKNSQKVFITPLLIGIVVLTVIVGCTYIYFGHFTTAISNTINTSTEPTESVNGYTNLRTYINSDFGFSFLFPADLTVHKNQIKDYCGGNLSVGETPQSDYGQPCVIKDSQGFIILPTSTSTNDFVWLSEISNHQPTINAFVGNVEGKPSFDVWVAHELKFLKSLGYKVSIKTIGANRVVEYEVDSTNVIFLYDENTGVQIEIDSNMETYANVKYYGPLARLIAQTLKFK